MPGRTWVIAPDKASLEARWNALIGKKDAARKAMLFHPHLRDDKPGDKHAAKVVKEGLAGRPHRTLPVAADKGAVIPPERYGFRSFDRQWIIPDARLLNQPNPTLWKWHSVQQVYATALMAHSPTSGPALTFTGLIPDLHHYKGSFGGRVFPLWADAAATTSNVAAEALERLELAYGRTVSGEEVFAYLAAVAAQPPTPPASQRTFASPGFASRSPLTRNCSPRRSR